MMEDLVFMGRDSDVRAADIRLRTCLLSVRCSRLDTPAADLTVLVKVSEHTPTRTAQSAE